jgi:long-subunit acyl-CoA synthetase (AMP-forming)
LFTLSWTKVFFKKLARHAIKRYYGRRLKALVIYNSVVNEEILSTLIGKLPIYTTYGSQETNQLVAINDYSTKELCKSNAVGYALPGINITTFENELEISSSSLFDKYVGDESYTREVRFKDNYVTGDVGFVDSNTNVMFVYGRVSAIYHNEFKLPIQLDRLERIIKSIPYVKEVLLYAHKNELEKQRLILLVYPDVNFVEAKGIGYLKLKELMRMYLSKINLELNNSVNIDGLRVVDIPLLKTHDGKVCRYYFK